MPKKSASSSSASKASAARDSWVDPDEAPELTDEMLDRAEIRIDGRVVQAGRPPLGDQPKSSVTLRLDADVLASYRATGAGWQTRLNADLRKIRKLGAAKTAQG
ncbi:MAG: hypothetical protein JWQ94_16 [Tardiphaga sp.]|nr:hypothetical protein [Tardiphaga sp.]